MSRIELLARVRTVMRKHASVSTVVPDQLAQLLEAGVAIPEALEFLASHVKTKYDDTVIQAGITAVLQGLPLSVGWTGIVPRLCLSLVRAGEESGMLTRALTAWAQFVNENQTWRKQLSKAFAYPLILVCFALLVLVVIFAYVLPMFESMYHSFGGSTANGIQMIRALATIVVTSGLSLSVALVGFILVLYRLRTHKPALWERVKKWLPWMHLVVTWRTSVFSWMLHMLVGAGIPLIRGVEIMGEEMNSRWIKEASHKILPELLEGKPLSEAFGRGVWHESLSLFIGVAERTGDVGHSLSQIANLTRSQFIAKLERVHRVLEPATVIVVSMIVFVTMLTLFLPMYQLMSNLGTTP